MRTILCIDDDVRTLSIRIKVLESNQYRVLAARSATEGLAVFAREGADIVLVDYFMPDMSGAEVAWELRRRGSDVPILMLSSNIFCPPEARDLVDAFCAKIDGPNELLTTIGELVSASEQRRRRPRRSILDVEENAAHRYASARTLRRAGYQVLEAATGAEAIAALSRHPDLVLLDVHLPDMDGDECCRRIKAFPDGAKIPVVHLNGAVTPACGGPMLAASTAPGQFLATITALLDHH